METVMVEEEWLGPVERKKLRGRSIASLLIFILAVILTPVAVIGHWTHTTITDTQAYVRVVGPLAENPAIQAAVGEVATKAVLKEVDTRKIVGGFLTKLLPDDDLAATLTGPLSAGVNQVIGVAVRQIMGSSAFQKAWDALNAAAQRSLIDALNDAPKGVIQIKGPDVVLDISSLLTEIQKQLVDQGINVASKVKVPESDAQITVMSSAAFEQLRTIWSFANPLLGFILLAVALLFTLSMLLSLRRARTTVAVGVTVFVIGGAMWMSLGWGVSQFTNNFTDTIFEAASVAFFQSLFVNLVQGLITMMILGVALVIAGWLAGRTARALGARKALNRGFADIASRTPAWTTNLGQPMRQFAPVLHWGLLILWLIVVFAAAQFGLASTIGWTALVLGVLTIAGILMATPDQRFLEIDEIEVVETG